MEFTSLLPTLNAYLNATALFLLTAGYFFIKREKKKAHRVCMLSAFGVSALFLFFYVLHKVLKHGVHTPFEGEGAWRRVYFFILITHIFLAMVILPLIGWTFRHALKGNWEKHRAWARVTFPLWYYVSITGVVIYFMLYQWF